MKKLYVIFSLSIVLGLAIFIAFTFLKSLASAVGASSKVNICHRTESERNPWEAIRINRSALDTHLDHGDFLYDGPTKDNGQPTRNGDEWCEENGPNEDGDDLSPTPTPIVDECDQDDDCISPIPTASPSATPTPEVTEAPRGETYAPQCTDTKPNKAPDNFHIYRKGDVARPVWFYDADITWRVVVYYGLTGQGDQHSKIFKNVSDNQELIEALGSRDFDFRATFLNGCAEGKSTSGVIDGSTRGWVLFR